jgi:hypothetical protein
MTSHEWTNELTPLYAMARKLREKAIAEGVHTLDVDVRSCMDVVLARLDLLGVSLGRDLLKLNEEEKV